MKRPPVRRIIIGATCFIDANAAIPIAVQLASQSNGEIEGLLVEDEAILDYAASPSARVVNLKGSSIERVTQGKMLDAFRRDASAFKKMLSASAGDAFVTWTFQSWRGQFTSLIDRTTNAGDMVLFGYSRAKLSPGEIIVVCDDVTAPEALINVAVKIAAERRLPLVILLPPSINETVAKYLNRMNMDQSHISIVSGADEVLEYLSKRSPIAVLLSKSRLLDMGLRILMDAARCPVIVMKTD
ncbi:MAG: hypothetical protein COB78_00060 [Hyphomicrobiales bacterium]|nr:MAG: hypothetical protein COB78_00060 [Hyphomicrobiales bacterium]